MDATPTVEHVDIVGRVLRAVIHVVLLGAVLWVVLRWTRSREEKARWRGRENPPALIRESPSFRLVRGVAVANLDGIGEGYMARPADEGQTALTVNVSAERLEEVIVALTAEVREPSSLVLDVPCREGVPQDPNRAESLSRDVFEMAPMTHARFATFFHKYADVLVNDGQTWLWYGTPDGDDSVAVGLFKTVHIATDDPAKYMRVLDALGYPEEPEIRTVADNISEQTPGYATLLDASGNTVYDVIEALKQDGLHMIERRDA